MQIVSSKKLTDVADILGAMLSDIQDGNINGKDFTASINSVARKLKITTEVKESHKTWNRISAEFKEEE